MLELQLSVGPLRSRFYGEAPNQSKKAQPTAVPLFEALGAMEGNVNLITPHRSCNVRLANDIMVAFSEPEGFTLRVGDQLNFAAIEPDKICLVENLSQGNTFRVVIAAHNMHDLRLPAKHGSSRIPTIERLHER